MQIDATWLFGIPVAFLVGLFIGERWEKWSEKDREPMQMEGEDKYLQDMYHMIDQHRSRKWNRKQAD